MIIPKGYPSSPSKTKSPTVLDVQEHVEVESFLHTKEAAEYIDMSVGYVKDHAQALGGEKHGLRWRFSYEALDRWKAEKK
jgi:hypothetical protein